MIIIVFEMVSYWNYDLYYTSTKTIFTNYKLVMGWYKLLEVLNHHRSIKQLKNYSFEFRFRNINIFKKSSDEKCTLNRFILFFVKISWDIITVYFTYLNGTKTLLLIEKMVKVSNRSTSYSRNVEWVYPLSCWRVNLAM